MSSDILTFSVSGEVFVQAISELFYIIVKFSLNIY